jgi:hypothetical protein
MARSDPGATLRCVKLDVTSNLRGGWNVRFSDRRATVSCDTLNAAIREAHRWAEESHPCELVIRDAYHRVVGHEFIDGEESGPARSSRPTVNA